MLLPPAGDDWVALSAEALPLEQLATWPVVPSCGAVVVFAGTVRDHAEGRPGVISLEYEAYEDVAAPDDGVDRAGTAQAVAVSRPGGAAAPHRFTLALRRSRS